MNEREEQLATQDAEARDEARMNDYVLPPDPDGHNRMLDKGAAEHLASVAPWLAPTDPDDSPDFVSDAQKELEARGHERVNRHVAPCLTCQAGLCAEHGPATTATTTGAGQIEDRAGVETGPLICAFPVPARVETTTGGANRERGGFAVIGSDGFDYTEYEVGRYATREEALLVVSQKTREHELSQPGGMPDRFSARRVPEAPPAPAAEAKGEMSRCEHGIASGYCVPCSRAEIAALRERCRRLEEAGDKMAALGTWHTACGWSLRDAWAAAKGEVAK